MENIDDEARFAANLKSLREQRGWSQGELARRMSEMGWQTYSQMTVSRTEKGERPVRLGEARAMARLLDTTVDEMTRGSDVEEYAGAIRGIGRSLAGAIVETADALWEYLRAYETAKEMDSRFGDAEAVQSAKAEMHQYLFPSLVVARWAAEAATDPMRDPGDGLTARDLLRMAQLEREHGEHQAEA